MHFTKYLSLWLFSGVLFAATATTPNTTTTQVATVPTAANDAKLIGEFELRPSYGSQKGEVHTEDTASLGYQFRKGLLVDFTQYFLTNFSSPDPDTTGLNLLADDAMLRIKASEVIKNNDTTVGVQSRVLLPTHSGRRNAGMLFVWRNQATAAQKFNNTVSVDFTAAPMFHVYDRAGNTASNNTTTANPWFQQRFVLNADVNLTDKLTFSVPVIIDATRTRDYAVTAANNDRWNYFLWAWPELAYQVTDNLKLGTAWYSDNFMSDSAAGFTLAKGFEKGVFQVFVNYSL